MSISEQKNPLGQVNEVNDSEYFQIDDALEGDSEWTNQ